MQYTIENDKVARLFSKIKYKQDPVNNSRFTKTLEYKGLFIREIEIRCLQCSKLIHSEFKVHDILWSEIIFKAFTPKSLSRYYNIHNQVNLEVSKLNPILAKEKDDIYRVGLMKLISENTNLNHLHKTSEITYNLMLTGAQPYLAGSLHLSCFSKLVEESIGRRFLLQDLVQNHPTNTDLFFTAKVIATHLSELPLE